MEILTKVKVILSNPTTFFKRNKEKGIQGALVFYMIFSLFSYLMFALLYYTIGVHFFKFLSQITGEEFEMITPVYFIINYFGSILGIFLFALIIFVLALLFKGKVTYISSYQVLVYSQLPSLLFGWIPILGWFFAPV